MIPVRKTVVLRTATIIGKIAREMENLLTVTLEAHNPEKNHHRQYQLMVGKDLLGYWTLTIRHGRVGAIGKMTRYALLKKSDIEKLIAIKLKKRASAPKRIGCSYLLKECDHAPGVSPGDWFGERLVSGGLHDEKC